MAARSKERIVRTARGLFGRGERPTVDQLAQAAGVSKASFYRAFGSRSELLKALDLGPEPESTDRILEAARRLIGEHGLNALSMDALADASGVSRATLYRLFPGKPALFTALLRTYSPLEPVANLINSRRADPPDVLMPEVARLIYRVASPQIGFLRALFFEVARTSPDADDAIRELLARILGSAGSYVVEQMSEGRLRTMHPLIALQSFVGPIFFHVITRAAVEKALAFDTEGEEVVTEFAHGWLRAMNPDSKEAA